MNLKLGKEFKMHYSFQLIGILFWSVLINYYWYTFQPEKIYEILLHAFFDFISVSILSFYTISIYNFIHSKIKKTLISVPIIVLFAITGPSQWIIIKAVLWKKGADEISLLSFEKATFNHVIFFLGLCGIYYVVRFWISLQSQKEKALKAIALANESKLMMLRYQINPHFLFNAFNSIQAMVEEDKDKARRMISELSKFFRYTLNSTEDTKVELTKELKAVRHYLGLQKLRFEEKLDIQYNIDDTKLDSTIPFFILLPLVENAVKYGMQSSSKPLRIVINAHHQNNRLVLSVQNTGALINNNERNKNDEGASIGLKNIKQRLELIYPQKHKFNIKEEEGWVIAKIEIEEANNSN